MVASLTYRTSDGTRWGGGFGSDLAAVQVDLNFWTLFSAIAALEDHADVGAGIDFINQPSAGNLFFIHLTDHRVLGPFVIPTAQWTPRGPWAPDTDYAAYDVVSEDGSLYLITIPHTSGSTFSAFATDGLGHLLYNLLLQNPENSLPSDGTVGQRLVKSTSSPFTSAWVSDRVRMFVFVAGNPVANELLLQYTVTDDMTIPAGLIATVVFARVPTLTNVSYPIFKNGSAIGSIDFEASPENVSITFGSDVACVPGDLIDILAPSIPDANQADISITLIALLT